MNGAEDMIVDHNMVVTQVFRRLGKRLDRPCIAAEFDLRINHTSFHRPLPLSRCKIPGPMTIANCKTEQTTSACRLECFTLTDGRARGSRRRSLRSRWRDVQRPRFAFDAPSCRRAA